MILNAILILFGISIYWGVMYIIAKCMKARSFLFDFKAREDFYRKNAFKAEDYKRHNKYK